MKRILTICCIFFSLSSKSQTFTLSDNSFNAGDVLRCYHIFFELGTDKIRAESHPFLDSLTAFLMINDTLILEISNHTDERWSNEISIKLTAKRAEAVMNYLVDKGINPARLFAVGYNDTMPIISGAKTEEEHHINRRTEFKILVGYYIPKKRDQH